MRERRGDPSRTVTRWRPNGHQELWRFSVVGFLPKQTEPTGNVISAQLTADTWSANNAGSMAQYMINTPLSGVLGRISVYVRWSGAAQNIEADFSCYTGPNGSGTNSCVGPLPVAQALSGESTGQYIEFDFTAQNWSFDPTKYYILRSTTEPLPQYHSTTTVLLLSWISKGQHRTCPRTPITMAMA